MKYPIIEKFKLFFYRIIDVITPPPAYEENTLEEVINVKETENHVIHYNDVIVEITSRHDVFDDCSKELIARIGYGVSITPGQKFIWYSNFPKKEVDIYLAAINSLNFPKGSVGICKEARSIGQPEFNIEVFLVKESYALFFREDVDNLKIRKDCSRKIREHLLYLRSSGSL